VPTIKRPFRKEGFFFIYACQCENPAGRIVKMAKEIPLPYSSDLQVEITGNKQEITLKIPAYPEKRDHLIASSRHW